MFLGTNVKRGRLYYIAGCDGTGKTTHAKLLVQALNERGIQAKQLWLRFPFFFSVPLLGYARMRGYSWYEIVDGVRHGYWDFTQSWLMRNIFPWVLLIDATLMAAINVTIPLLLGKTIVCERFVLDTLVDLEVGLKDNKLHTKLPGSLYKCLLPRKAKIIILDAEINLIQERRPDLRSDTQLEMRLDAYRNLAYDYSINLFSNINDVVEVNRRIINHVLDK